MAFAEKKQNEQVVFPPEQKDTSRVLDENELFTGKPLPYKEVDFIGADGKEGKLLVQALTLKEIEEVNHIQGLPTKDARGNIVEEANQIGWDAKICARAARKTNKMPMGGDHWLALAEKIASQWLPGTTKSIRNEILVLSGYLPMAKAEAKKDS